MMEMGGNTILTISADKKYTQHAYFKIPDGADARRRTACRTTAGSFRCRAATSWCRAGIRAASTSWTSPIPTIRSRSRTSTAVRSIAGADADAAGATPAGAQRRSAALRTRSAARGARTTGTATIYSSELARGFDILELLPSDKLSANEIAAAKLVRFTEYNPQSQPKIVWPAAFPVVRSYLDQLVRDNGLSAERTTAIGKALDAAEKQTGAARGASLTALATAGGRRRERREGSRARAARCRRRSSGSRRRRSKRPSYEASAATQDNDKPTSKGVGLLLWSAASRINGVPRLRPLSAPWAKRSLRKQRSALARACSIDES